MQFANLPTFALVPFMLYFTFIGGTWRGLSSPIVQIINVAIITAITSTWMILRSRRRYLWKWTALHALIPLWAIAVALSTAANLLKFNQSITGIGMLLGYTLVWLLLVDLHNNAFFSLKQLIQAWVIASVPVVIWCLAALFVSRTLRQSVVLENPNILGGYFVLLIPLIAGLAAQAKVDAQAQARKPTLMRLLNAYLVLIMLLLLLTQSRGALLSAAVGWSFLVVVLQLRSRRRRYPHRDQEIDPTPNPTGPRATNLASMTFIAVALVVATIAVQFVRDPDLDRVDNGRFPIYQTAIRDFAAHPWFGTGIFTFRTPPARTVRLTPGGQNAHAHDVVFHVGAELGTVGIVVLVISVATLIWSRRRQHADLALYISAALVGISVHQLIDLTLLTPFLALLFLSLTIPERG